MFIKRLFKSILKYKTSSILTLLSLVISFLGIIILSLYVSYEKSFDQFHENKNNIYVLKTRMYDYNLPEVLKEVIDKNLPEVEKSLVLKFYGDTRVTTPQLQVTKTFFDAKRMMGSADFFDVFSFNLLQGEKDKVLKNPYTAVISQTLASKLFNDKTAIGETINIYGEKFTITGIMEDFPKTSSFSTDCITSYATYTQQNRSLDDRYSEWSFQIVLQLKDHVDSYDMARKIESIPDLVETFEYFKSKYGDEDIFYVKPYSEIHFDVSNTSVKTVNPIILKVLIILAIVLAVMGMVNFINFSTSQAPLRSKALSVTQVLGSNRFSSMLQIIAEAITISLLALTISLAIYYEVYSGIESLFNIEGLAINGRYYFLFIFIAFAIVFGVISGIYPARYISSPPLAQAIKGTGYFKGKGKLFRNILVTLQFVFTIALLSSSLMIEKQLNFWNNFDLGINKENVVFLHTTKSIENHAEAFAQELLKDTAIVDYTYTQFIPGKVVMGWGREIDGQYVQLKAWPVDDRFISFFNIEMDEGRAFKRNSKADINSFILNRKAINEFGWTNPLEKNYPGFDFEGPIVGIAKNFHFSSLKEDIQPMLFWRTDTRKEELLLRVIATNYTQLFNSITAKAKEFDPENNFEVQFLDDSLNELYAKEKNTARFIEFVSLWCMLLAITGVLGLVVFISRDRVKEIGIRKVNGAQTAEVVFLINKDFIKWIAIAFIIATPFAWFVLNNWLQDFAYKTEMSWWIFAVSGLISLFIAMVTITWQSWKAATRNPVEALRYE